MKAKALFSGHNGVESYPAGTVLEGSDDHIMRLLFNNAAVPKDAEAKEFVNQRDTMTDKQAKASKHFNQSIRDYVLENDTGGVNNKKRSGAKGAKKATNRKKGK